jgi:hypothetical protein
MTKPLETPDNTALESWETSVRKEIDEITAAIEPLQVRLASARERLDLIQRLRHLAVGPATVVADEAYTTGAALQRSGAAGGVDIEAQLEDVLRKHGTPMHIRGIRQALVERGVPLPGRGDEANLILRLRRAPSRFTRTGRGIYALASLGIPEVPPTKRRKRVLRRKGSAQ